MSKIVPNFSNVLHVLNTGSELALMPLSEHKEYIDGTKITAD